MYVVLQAPAAFGLTTFLLHEVSVYFHFIYHLKKYLLLTIYMYLCCIQAKYLIFCLYITFCSFLNIHFTCAVKIITNKQKGYKKKKIKLFKDEATANLWHEEVKLNILICFAVY